MIFIGKGALLRKALLTVASHGIKIDLVCLSDDDGLARYCDRNKIPKLVSRDPSNDLLEHIHRCSDRVIMSVDNRYILRDNLLDSEYRFFNVHNGLVQHYRGIAEVCVFAAICQNSQKYGATLHQLLPGQEVDAGPVISQREFNFADSENFETVFRKSLTNCEELFDSEVLRLLEPGSSYSNYRHGTDVYGYQDLPKIISKTPSGRLQLAQDLGVFSALLPKLQRQIDFGLNRRL